MNPGFKLQCVKLTLLTLACYVFLAIFPAGFVGFTSPAFADRGSELDTDQYFEDLQYLASFSHRLPGSEEAAKSGEYIEKRLRELGIEDVFTYRMEVPHLSLRRCEMVFEDESVSLLPMRPNLTVPPATPEGGVTGPLIYAGGGEIADYGNRSPEGAIVLLDYDNYDNWQRAFSLGAKAVVFLGDGEETASVPLHTPLPINLLRFYADREVFEDLDLLDTTEVKAEVTIYSEVTWEDREDVNVIARIPGTSPKLDGAIEWPESMVMSATYDSFGEVPHRSPGARRAANVAALLSVAEYFSNSPASRDLIFMFLGNRSYNHQGAREVYDALLMELDQHEELMELHAEEQEELKEAHQLLQEDGLLFDRDADGGEALESIVRRHARQARDDISMELRILRIRFWEDREDEEFIEREERKEQEQLVWDDIRRAIDDGRLKEMVEAQREYAEGVFETPEAQMWDQRGRDEAQERAQQYKKLFSYLAEDIKDYMHLQLEELEKRFTRDDERTALRDGLFEQEDIYEAVRRQRAVTLHISFDFSDSGPEWGVCAIHEHRLLTGQDLPESGDNPGNYSRVLSAFRQADDALEDVNELSSRTLRNPRFGTTFIPGYLAPEGLVAGGYGIFNVALATGYDRRLRDGHPADTLENLDGDRIFEQVCEAARVIRWLANDRAMSLASLFSPEATSKYPDWRRGRPRGERATKVVAGGLDETRPARGALIAQWPGSQWRNLQNADSIADFSPFSLERSDAVGRYRMLGARRDYAHEHSAFGAIFDEAGRVQLISSDDARAFELPETGRPTMFHVAEGGAIVGHSPVYRIPPDSMRVLRASTNTSFPGEQVLSGSLGQFSFAYIAAQNVDASLKFIQPLGPFVLGEFTEDQPSGTGLTLGQLRYPLRSSLYTHGGLWGLNESRLQALRSRGISRIDLERIHSAAMTALMDIEYAGENVAARESLKQSSASLSHRIYRPLLGALDDLVIAIIILLLLSIPFAFAMERLLVCATSIYKRITGFVCMFFLTFGLLYFMHPGFAIAATPIIIFLAFGILLLCSMTIYILLRKFDTELKVLQGQSSAMHEVEMARTGTLLAAVNMGMSTMRRRPTRTFLSAITAVILTFTILCFASFTREVRVRSIYEGPVGEEMPQSILVRNIDYSELPRGIPEMLRHRAADDVLLAEHWWATRKEEDDPPLSAANPAKGESLDLDAVMGLTPEEMLHWPALSEILDGDEGVEEKMENLQEGKVYLAQGIMALLGLETGDRFLLDGYSVELAGAIDTAKFQLLRNVDNNPVLPVNFADVDPEAMEYDDDDDEAREMVRGEVQRSFTRLTPSSIVVASDALARRLGGTRHALNVYPSDDVPIADQGHELAQILPVPIWAAGEDGVERMFLTSVIELGGRLAIAVPLILGGFIIFGTLLASITDREREIYTFSALGLSPNHVGMLFFAEAAVYAVVGGMGGQLLAQATAMVASVLARHGLIQEFTINFSSTNSLFAIGGVMVVVLVSAIYPARRAARSANPGLARTWRMPSPEGDNLDMTFPFTVSAYDITGVVSFLAEHFRSHDDAGLGKFASSNVEITKNDEGYLELSADLALAPFDLGVTQHFVLTAVPSEIEGVDEIAIHITRSSGARGDWIRCNKVFLRDMRVQFLVWRTLSEEAVEEYRIETLKIFGEEGQSED